MNIKNILIVEDEILIAEGIKMHLEEIGYKVQEIAISYDEAVDFVNNYPIDLALLDIRLYGEKSGVELAEYLKREDVNIPFVYLTSQYDKRILERALSTNPLGYLVKPIQKHSLYTTIETAFNKIDSEKIVQIKSGKTTHNVKIKDVMYIKSDHVYCEIVTSKNTVVLTRCSLSNLIDLFDSDKIIRCHRSFAINNSYVNRWDNNHIVMTDNSEIPVSRSFKSLLKNIL